MPGSCRSNSRRSTLPTSASAGEPPATSAPPSPSSATGRRAGSTTRLFTALRERLGTIWTDWDSPLRDRTPAALDEARRTYAQVIERHAFSQFVFFEQWEGVRARARDRGIRLIGDIPIFVAHDSADVWSHQHLFKLKPDGHPHVIAGVPPDYFSATGQLWGNPLYDWDTIASEEYLWWIARFRHLLEEVDIIRIDHFRGFEAAWEVPFGESTAVNGQWVRGPGASVFSAIGDAIGSGPPPVVAEDLGLITDEVRSVLLETGFPGMKVLQFAFGGGSDNPYLPHNYEDTNCLRLHRHARQRHHAWLVFGSVGRGAHPSVPLPGHGRLADCL